MNPLSERMSGHHRDCDALFAEADNAAARGDWPAAGTAFEGFREAMEAHFVAEESVIFPRFEEVTGMRDGPTEVMRGEHADMREAFVHMAEALACRDREGYAGESETLLVLMQQHNMKEESVLYPMCDRRLGVEIEAMLSVLPGRAAEKNA